MRGNTPKGDISDQENRPHAHASASALFSVRNESRPITFKAALLAFYRRGSHGRDERVNRIVYRQVKRNIPLLISSGIRLLVPVLIRGLTVGGV